jgi:hypothetical protein
MDKINRACQDVRDIIGDYSMWWNWDFNGLIKKVRG